ncbi:hypothetical protein [Phaeobacter gallaeciensis]|uniref:hypothetical protein n=1 Tax=Phaeobacter gallaeciensis TaxID=60890 RepID=UPI00237FB271|nr:hypothetical protein [Phaeobacter gallaeciensis]
MTAPPRRRRAVKRGQIALAFKREMARVSTLRDAGDGSGRVTSSSGWRKPISRAARIGQASSIS